MGTASRPQSGLSRNVQSLVGLLPRWREDLDRPSSQDSRHPILNMNAPADAPGFQLVRHMWWQHATSAPAIVVGADEHPHVLHLGSLQGIDPLSERFRC